MGGREIEEFLTYLAVKRKVSASTQNQALNAVVFLFKRILGKEPGEFKAVRAKQRKHLPVVLSQAEVRRVPDARNRDGFRFRRGNREGVERNLIAVRR